LFHNKPYSTAKRKNSGTGRTRPTALTAALRNGKIKTKVVTTSILASITDNLHYRFACIYTVPYRARADTRAEKAYRGKARDF